MHRSPFGRAIRHERKRAGLTLVECAERVGISKGALSDIERGRRNPSLKVFLKLTGVIAQAYRP